MNDQLGIALMLFNLAEIAENESDFLRAIVFHVHAGRIFNELQSAFLSASTEALSVMEAKVPDFAALRAEAEGMGWEELIE